MLLSERQPDDVQELHSGRTIQLVVHREFWTLQQLGYEVTVLTPMERIDTYRRAAYLATTTTAGPLSQEQHATFTDSLLACRHPHPQCPTQFHLHSSHISMAALVVSALLCRICSFSQLWCANQRTISAVSLAPSLKSNNSSHPCCSHFFLRLLHVPTFISLHTSRLHVTLRWDCRTSMIASWGWHSCTLSAVLTLH